MFNNNKAIKVIYQEVVNLKYIFIEVEAKTAIKHGLVMAIKTLLNIIFITL